MIKKVRKAIIPAAGFGTRFLPATKAQPKEMLPIVDKPIIQYVVEDAVSAGIEDIIIITGWSKRSIEDHFDYPYELEKRLEATGKLEELEDIRKIADMANFYYLRQKGPIGNATPIWNARDFIDNEPFLVLWGDDIVDATPSRCQQLISAYEKFGGSVVMSSIRASNSEDYRRYGYAVGNEIESGVVKIDKLVEKPGSAEKVSGSDFAVVSGSLLGPEIFDAIEELMKTYDSSSGKELTYIDAVNWLLQKGKNCYATEIKNGKYHDCGNKLEYLKTVVEYGLKHEDLRDEFAKFLKEVKP
jgi:UTP--glucose-1-phosphate uridylyltransferase